MSVLERRGSTPYSHLIKKESDQVFNQSLHKAQIKRIAEHSIAVLSEVQERMGCFFAN